MKLNRKSDKIPHFLIQLNDTKLSEIAPFHETRRLKLEYKINRKRVTNGQRFGEDNLLNNFNKSTLLNAFCMSRAQAKTPELLCR